MVCSRESHHCSGSLLCDPHRREEIVQNCDEYEARGISRNLVDIMGQRKQSVDWCPCLVIWGHGSCMQAIKVGPMLRDGLRAQLTPVAGVEGGQGW